MNITKEALMRHLLRRLGFYLVALWASLTVNFIIPRMAPGDPAQTLIGQMRGQASPQALQSLRELLGEGSGTSWWTQYGQYFVNLLHGNLGISARYSGQPVTLMIGQGLLWTLGLVGMAVLITFFLGTLLGIRGASKLNSWLVRTLAPLVTFLSSIRDFWFAL